MAVVDPVTSARQERSPRVGERAPARTRKRRRTPATWVRGGGLTSLLFLLPMLAIFGAFSWYPIVRTVIMSLQHTNLVQPATWVGLDNFRKVLDDPLLPKAIRNTAEFALLALIFGYPIPLVAAVLMSEVRRFRGVYAALAYLPVVIPPVVAVLLWKTFYDGGANGVFNTILGWVGIAPHTALPSLVLESTWANAGGTIIIYLAAITGVNRELYEAASVDGASLRHKVFYITMPQLRGVMLLTMILQLIGTAQVFLEPYLFTSGGPINSTLTVLLLIFNYAFGNSLGGDYGEATALSLMLAGFLAVCSVAYLRATRSWSTT
jgi:multiple sugar transport system permease protein